MAGLILLFQGWHRLGPDPRLPLVLMAVAVGTVKSLLLLDRIARRALDRIHRFDDNTCLGAVYSWKSWLLVLAMIAMGLAARHFWRANPFLDLLYLAVGWSLLFSSRLGWRLFWYTR